MRKTKTVIFKFDERSLVDKQTLKEQGRMSGTSDCSKPIVPPLKSKPIEFGSEAARRYKHSLDLLQRIVTASGKAHYEDGETLDDTIELARELLSNEALELEIFGLPETNPNWPAPLPNGNAPADN